MSVQQDEVRFIRKPTYFPRHSNSPNISDEENDATNEGLNLSNANPNSNGATWYAAVFLIVNAALGAGLLDFPQTFGQAGGVYVALIVQMILLSFVVGAILILAYCSDAHESKTYQDVIHSVCGKRAHQACLVVVTLYCFGTCVTFVIIIGDQLDRVFSSLYGTTFCHHWYMNRFFTVSFSCLLFILPLCFPKRIDFLKYASSFGVLAVLYIEFVIIYKYYEGKYIPGDIKTKPDNWTDVFLVVPVICFGYQCHVSCVPVYSCLKDKSVKLFIRTVVVAILICAFTYTIAATYGYLTFGSNVQSDILYMYDPKDTVVLVGIIALAIKILTTYPILQFCGRAAVDDLYVQLRLLTPIEANITEGRRRITISIVWFLCSVTLALFLPDIGIVIEYLGSLAAVFIFIFPGLCLLELTLWNDTYFYRVSSKVYIGIAGLFLTIGFFIFGLVLAQSITTNLKPKTESTLKLCT